VIKLPVCTPEQREAARTLAVAAYVEKCRIAREAKAAARAAHIIGAGDKVVYAGCTWKVKTVDNGYALVARGGKEKRVPVGTLRLKDMV
jgi:hypothetical protein